MRAAGELSTPLRSHTILEALGAVEHLRRQRQHPGLINHLNEDGVRLELYMLICFQGILRLVIWSFSNKDAKEASIPSQYWTCVTKNIFSPRRILEYMSWGYVDPSSLQLFDRDNLLSLILIRK